MAEYETIDLSYVKDLSGGDEDVIIELIELFLENAPEAIDNIKMHFDEQDWDKLGKEAHKFKPNLAYMGVEKARMLIVEIEKNAKNQNALDEISEKISRVESICEQAYTELNSALKDMK